MHTFTVSYSWDGLYVFMCNIAQNTLGSYIKFNPGHRPGPAVTLGGSVPNDIHHLGSNKAAVSTEDRPFLIYLLSWWNRWVKGRQQLVSPIIRPAMNSGNCSGPSCSIICWVFLVQFFPPCVSLCGAQRWSGRLFKLQKPQTWTMQFQVINFVGRIIYS